MGVLGYPLFHRSDPNVSRSPVSGCRATPVTITDTVDFAPNVHITQEDMRGVMMDAGHKPGLVRIETLPRMRLLKSVQVG